VGVSVIIPCLNEEKYIGDCLISLLSNGYPPDELELLVVDGGSTDSTLSILEDLKLTYPQIRIVHNLKKFTPFALNLGIQHASHSLILISGAHARFNTGYIQELVQVIQSNKADVAGGVMETQTKSDSPKTRAIKVVLTSGAGVGNSLFRTGVNEIREVDTVPFGLYRKEVFEQCGLYDTRLIRNHDIELSKRILSKGFRIVLVPSARCTYYARESFGELAKNNYGNGYWNIKTLLITRKFDSLSFRHYVPLLFILSLIVPTVLAIVWIYFIIISGLSLIAYLVLILFQVSKAKTSNKWMLMWAYLVLHFSYGIGSLFGCFSIFKAKKHQ